MCCCIWTALVRSAKGAKRVGPLPERRTKWCTRVEQGCFGHGNCRVLCQNAAFQAVMEMFLWWISAGVEGGTNCLCVSAIGIVAGG